MACDTRLKEKQSPAQRAEEVRRMVATLSAGLASGRVKAIVGRQGAIAFAGLGEDERAGVSDACAFRAIMVSGSALARAAIAKAEMLAGRTVDRQVVAAGVHSHTAGRSWDHGH